MSTGKYVTATAVLALLAALVFSAERAATDKPDASQKQSASAKDAPSETPAAATETKAVDAKAAAQARYARITSKNIFYPRRQAAADAGEAGANPRGAGLVLTGVVRARGETYAVVQNTGTGEASIVTVGEATGGGELVAATMDGITVSTESGTFKVAVGSYLSGAKGPDLAAPVKVPEAQPAGSPPGAPAGQAAPAGSQLAAPGGPQPPTGQGDPNADGGRRSARGGRGRMSQEQMDAFRNMTPEQRDQMRQQFQQFRQRRSRRPDNAGENQ